MPVPFQEAGITDAVRRAFALKGRFGVAFDEIIVGVALVDDLSDFDQQRWNRIWGGELRAAGGVGLRNTWQVQNPAGSGVLLEITGVDFNDEQGQTSDYRISVNQTTGALTTILGILGRDQRLGAADIPIIFRWEAIAGLLATPSAHYTLIANGHLSSDVGIVLPPGTSAWFQHETLNIASGFNWRGRFRFLSSSEPR